MFVVGAVEPCFLFPVGCHNGVVLFLGESSHATVTGSFGNLILHTIDVVPRARQCLSGGKAVGNAAFESAWVLPGSWA
jgi:hypothetical protein